MLRWLLPENIADVLPSEARRIEELRRRLLDLYRSYGYELVMPPLIEHLDSLLTGSGADLGLRTFQLVDQLSGRTLGVRADMTPQVARIDAHLLNRDGITRLCYAGSVLHTRPQGLFATREPIHAGAELYGHAGIEADLEAIELLVRSLDSAGVAKVRIDLCHAAIVPALLELDGASDERDVEALYALLRGKDVPGLDEWLHGASPSLRAALRALPGLHGRVTAGSARSLEAAGGAGGAGAAGSPLARARAALPPAAPIAAALEQLERLCASPLWQRWPAVELSVDLADLRGYRYHNGITFAAYVEGLPYAIARGGRYDNVGRAFGRARPATGFSIELRALAGLGTVAEPVSAIRAPWSDDAALIEKVAALRAAGEIVIQVLPGHEQEQQEFACDRELVMQAGRWNVRRLDQA
ncbi:MAG: ATP phosphoribosyltransferase regulatory subunit [Burkholderiaceae bacterium]|nr:ATP phosphoribosyltransferase regulatory subunit [Burkholderiaceae bacterium]MBX3613280.1 ATP phosphoribosyltransferase regulatory subunit [Burkholderiaceae bacterium]